MAKDVVQRIRDGYSHFSKGQKKIANAILQDCEKTAYLTAGRIGNLVGVSEATVVRFAGVLGYEGFSELQHAMQELVRVKLTPNQRIAVTKQRMYRKDIIENVMQSDITRIKQTFETLDRDAFYGAVDAITTARKIYVIGARSADTLAQFLAYNLSLIYDNVKHVQAISDAEIFEQIFTIGEGDVLIAFSFPRYSTKMVNAVKYAKENGAKVVVFTDSSLSPISEYATHLLLGQSDTASFMDSFVAPMSIINAIIIHITHKNEKAILQRFDKLEQVWDKYRVYAKR